MAENPMIQDIADQNANGGYDYNNLFGDFFTGGAVTQSELNDWNMQFQEQQFAYQKWLNEQQHLREDSAYQRKVADLRAAGLHPALALSGGGAGATALSAGNSAPNLSAGFKKQLGVADILQLMTATSSIHKQNAESSYATLMGEKAKAEADRIKLENDIMSYDFAKAQQDGVYYNKRGGLASDFANIFSMLENGDYDSRISDFLNNRVSDVVNGASNIFEGVSNKVNEVTSSFVEKQNSKKLEKYRQENYQESLKFIKFLSEHPPKKLTPIQEMSFQKALTVLGDTDNDKLRSLLKKLSDIYGIK